MSTTIETRTPSISSWMHGTTPIIQVNDPDERVTDICQSLKAVGQDVVFCPEEMTSEGWAPPAFLLRGVKNHRTVLEILTRKR